MSLLFFLSLALFLVAEVVSATRIFSSRHPVRRSTLAVWCLVPLLIVSVLLWNHADLFDLIRSSPSVASVTAN